jgi:hypothetical protein
MGERGWKAGADPLALLALLRGRADRRKPRLFACACCRRVWHLLGDERSRRAVEAAEGFADGLVDAGQLEQARRQAAAVGTCVERAARAAEAAARHGPEWGGRETCYLAADVAYDCSGAVADAVAGSRGGWDWARASEAEERAQSRLLLDLYGDPGQPFTTLDPSWLAWEGGLIPRLAQAIYEERAFDQLPVLADALEDAGCPAGSAGDRASQAILQHLRGPGPHARGCHILDAILGRH